MSRLSATLKIFNLILQCADESEFTHWNTVSNVPTTVIMLTWSIVFKTKCLTQRTCSVSPYAGWATGNLPEIPSYCTYECLILITQRYVILWKEGNQTAAMSVCFLMHPPLQARLITGIKLGTSLLLRGIRSKDNKSKTILLNGV